MLVTLKSAGTAIAICEHFDVDRQIQIYKDAGYLDIKVDAQELSKADHNEKNTQLRTKIYADTDIHSLLGTTADAAQVLVLFACADAAALASSATFAAYKQARMDALTQLSGSPASAAELVSKAGQLLADVQAGTVLMPFLVKPGKAAGVFDDVATRATAVAQVLAASQA